MDTSLRSSAVSNPAALNFSCCPLDKGNDRKALNMILKIPPKGGAHYLEKDEGKG